MAKKKIVASYFQEHSRLLKNVISDYSTNCITENLFTTNDYAIFNNIEIGITKHPLRKYQKEALFILDYLLRCNDNKPQKKQLLEEVDKDTKTKAPFMGYEMATGSGKGSKEQLSIYIYGKGGC